MSATPAELPLFHADIRSQWIDYNGHLRDAYYAVVLSEAIDDMMEHLGLDAAYRSRTRCTLYTLEMHLHYLHEVFADDRLAVRTLVLDADRKRIHAGLSFHCGRLEEAVATGEVMLLHVRQDDPPASLPFSADVDQRLQTLKLAPAARSAWGPASRQIAMRRT